MCIRTGRPVEHVERTNKHTNKQTNIGVLKFRSIAIIFTCQSYVGTNSRVFFLIIFRKFLNDLVRHDMDIIIERYRWHIVPAKMMYVFVFKGPRTRKSSKEMITPSLSL